MKIQDFLQVGFMALILSGCQTAPTMHYDCTPDYVAPSGYKINAQLQSIVVTAVEPEERTGVMPKESELIPIIQEWEQALSVALSQSKNFESESANKVNLIVKILKIEKVSIIPFITLQSTADITASYLVVEVGTGKILFRKEISSSGVGLIFTNGGGMFGNFTNIDRVSENTAIRLNIEKLLRALNDNY
jgi:hypothetical protein